MAAAEDTVIAECLSASSASFAKASAIFRKKADAILLHQLSEKCFSTGDTQT